MPRAHKFQLLHHKAAADSSCRVQIICPSASGAAAFPSVPHKSSTARTTCRSRHLIAIISSAMKQKIVIRLSMACDKCRSKAMVLAAKADGVSKMGITGDGKDQLEVEGDSIDTVCLVKCLRKKVGRAEIVKVEEVKPEEKKVEEKKPEEKKPDEIVPLPYGWWYPNYNYYHYHPQW